MDSANSTGDYAASPSPAYAAAFAGNSSSAAAALSNGTLGVGFSGSGFLIFYFTGVIAVLQHLGIISNSTRIAGTSGGSAVSAMTCAGVPAQKQYNTSLEFAQLCRAQNNCQGFLDSGFNTSLSQNIPENAAEPCTGRLWISITAAKPDNISDENILVGGNWTNQREIVDAVRLSSFIPGVSALAATLELPDVPSASPAYDGGFTQSLPCPPGVSYCIKVASSPVTPEQNAAGLAYFIQQFNNATASPQGAALAAGPATAPFLPLNPITLPEPVADIYPGLSKPLPVNATVWSSWGLSVPNDTDIATIHDIGRQDAAFWANKEGLATAAEATAAVQATGLSR